MEREQKMKSKWKKGTAGAIAVTAAAVLTTAAITTTAFAAKADIGQEENVTQNQATPSNAGKATPSEAGRKEPVFIPKKQELKKVEKKETKIIEETQETVQSGKLGETVIWTYDWEEKVMTISGTGDMEWPEEEMEFLQARSDVEEIKIKSGVTSVAASVFKNAPALKKVVIGNDVKRIGEEAFRECPQLKTVILGNHVEVIEYSAFAYSESLETVTFGEGLEVIGSCAFAGCSSLKTVTIPERTQSLEENAFMDCSSLRNVTLGKNLQKIRSSAFARCEKLSSIEIPDSVTFIECGAFEGCSELETVKFGTGLTYLGGSAFGYCEKLKEVTLVQALETMEQGVFYQCTSLETVTIEGTTPAELLTYWKDPHGEIAYIYDEDGNREETDIAFAGTKFVIDQTKGILVPKGTLTAYKKAWPEWAAYLKGAGESGSGGGSGRSSSRTSSPSYTVTGSWTQQSDGNWTFTDRSGKSYQNEWAAVNRSDASDGTAIYEWFRFDENNQMITGWFTDPADGNTYYLNPVSDGSKGSMCTGWKWIDTDGDGIAECYFFHTVSDGTKGRLFKNSVTPDGYEVNEQGQWVTEGKVQTKKVLN